MRPYFHNQHNIAYYRCLAHIQGYEKCGQKAVSANKLDEQIVEILSNLVIPPDYRERIELEISKRIEGEFAAKRMQDIQEIIQRIDISWENGFMDKDTYLEKRRQLTNEFEALRPIDVDELNKAADLLQNFRTYWDGCENLENPAEARHQLIARIVEHIFVYDDTIVGVMLYGNFAVVLGENKTTSLEVREVVLLILQNFSGSVISSLFGGDGVRLILCTKSILFLSSKLHGGGYRRGKLSLWILVEQGIALLHPTSARKLWLYSSN